MVKSSRFGFGYVPFHPTPIYPRPRRPRGWLNYGEVRCEESNAIPWDERQALRTLIPIRAPSETGEKE